MINQLTKLLKQLTELLKAVRWVLAVLAIGGTAGGTAWLHHGTQSQLDQRHAAFMNLSNRVSILENSSK